MDQAARVEDLTDHPGQLGGPGEPRVLIEGKPAAVAVATLHICAFPPPAGPHPTNNIASGSAKVFIGGRPAARVNDSCLCGAHIVTGAATVWIG